MAKRNVDPSAGFDWDDALAGGPLVSNVTAARMLGIDLDSLRSVAKAQLDKKDGIVLRVPWERVAHTFDRRTAVYFRAAVELYRDTRGEPVGRPRRERATEPGQ